MSGTWARLGPLGNLLELPDVQAGRETEHARAVSTFPTLGGRVRVQYGPRAPRTWTTSNTWLTPDQAAYLTACAQGAVAGDLYLYTQDAARTNLLRPHLAAPGSAGDTALGDVSASSVTVPGIGPMRGVASAAAAGAWSETIPVLPGVAYTLSCWAAAAASMSAGTTVLQWQTVNAAGVYLAQGGVATSAAGAVARAVTTFTPGAIAVGVQLRVAAGAGRTISALRLTEGPPPDASWVQGVGAGQVAVDDPGITLQAIWDDQIRSDYSWTIREVG